MVMLIKKVLFNSKTLAQRGQRLVISIFFLYAMKIIRVDMQREREREREWSFHKLYKGKFRFPTMCTSKKEM